MQKIIVSAILMLVFQCLGNSQSENAVKNEPLMNTQSKMVVEIWSDVMCPFCYIGKRKFEAALDQFPHHDNVEIIWKSFQLSPGMKTDPTKNIHEYLATHKGISVEQAKRLNDQVTEMAMEVGLTYNFEKSVVANSFNAHRFTHFAKEHGRQKEAEELLFRSYFTDGRNIDDYSTLVELGTEIGLDAETLKLALENGSYAGDVQSDIDEADQAGVRGVPFFLFNGKYAVTGAQESKIFLKTLEKAYEEWNESKRP
jgi:predicted DsbA family dithiol-disulfide isomerase